MNKTHSYSKFTFSKPEMNLLNELSIWGLNEGKRQIIEIVSVGEKP